MPRPAVLAVGDTIAIGVGYERVGATQGFFVVAETIAVLVGIGVGRGGRVAEIKTFPIVRVSVGVLVSVGERVEQAVKFVDIVYTVAVEIGGVGIGRGLLGEEKPGKKHRIR